MCPSLASEEGREGEGRDGDSVEREERGGGGGEEEGRKGEEDVTEDRRKLREGDEMKDTECRPKPTTVRTPGSFGQIWGLEANGQV